MESKLEPKRRLNPVARAARRRRILARRRLGWTYEDIAQAEGLTAARIGQIVREGFDQGALSSAAALRDRRVARLLATLGAASRAVGRGDLTAIDPLIRALDLLRGRPPADVDRPSYQDRDRGRLLEKLNRAAAELAETEPRPAPAAGRCRRTAANPNAGPVEAQEDDRKFFSRLALPITH